MVIQKIKIENKSAYVISCKYLFANINAITFYNLIIIRKHLSKNLPLLVHEGVHVLQWRKDKLFLPKYLYSYIQSRLSGKDHKSAYQNISYEIEAYDLEKIFISNYMIDKK